jgi:hypothetical protein
MGLGVSADQLDYTVSRDFYNHVFYVGGTESFRIRKDYTINTANSILSPTWTGSPTHSAVTVMQGYSLSQTFRDIDIRGGWVGGEGHAITAVHGTSNTNIVGQMVFQHDNPGSRIKWGRLYHGGDTSTFPMELISNGTAARLAIGSSSKIQFANEVKDDKITFFDNLGDAYGIGVRSNSLLIYNGYAAAASGGVLIGKYNSTTSDFTTHLHIRNSGVTTIPNQPYMFVGSTGGDIAGSYVKLTSYTDVASNIGNNYNTTNQRFTAPVAGYYYMHLQAWQGPGIALSGLAIRRNGNELCIQRLSSSGTHTDYTTIRAFGVYYLAAGDYLEPYTHISTSLHLSTGGVFSQFVVYLIS